MDTIPSEVEKEITKSATSDNVPLKKSALNSAINPTEERAERDIASHQYSKNFLKMFILPFYSTRQFSYHLAAQRWGSAVRGAQQSAVRCMPLGGNKMSNIVFARVVLVVFLNVGDKFVAKFRVFFMPLVLRRDD